MLDILVVDDEPSMARGIKINLKEYERAGGIVDVATSCEEAIELLNKKGYNVVISDGLNGRWKDVYEAAVMTLKNPYIIVLSGEEKHVEAAEALGLAGFVKGMSLKPVKEAIEKYFAKKL